MGAPPPPLYRLARIFRVLSTLSLVAIVAFVAFAAYSGVRDHPSGSWQSGWSSSGFTGSMMQAGTFVSVSNPGYLSLTGFRVEAEFSLPNGTSAGRVSSTPVDVPAHGNISIPVTLVILLTSGPAAAALLTQDSTLVLHGNLSATYAYLFGLTLSVGRNTSWGAPFAGLKATVGPPVTSGNGSVLAPVTLTWANHGPSSEQGSLSVIVRDATGTSCGSATFPVNVPSAGAFNQTQSVPLSSGCNPSGGTVLSVFSGTGFSLALPPQAIP
jgi:hypothetical protein